MSDTAQLLVAIDCPADEAELQARRAVDSLVDRGVIASETPDAVWGRVGHAPGPAFPGAVEGDIGTRPEFWAMPDGVEVETGRSFVADPSFEMSLHCPRCVTTFDTDPDEWGDAAMKWLDGDDATYYAVVLAVTSNLSRSGTGRIPPGSDIWPYISGTGPR